LLPWNEYIHAVKSGQRTVGRLEAMAVDHVLRLSRKKEYYFDEDEAERVLNLVSMFKHTKGKWYGKRFNLMPHQAFFFAYLFGMKKKSDGMRLFREAVHCMAKKGGKSEEAGAIAVLMTYFDGEHSAECYSVANKMDQAMYCWNSAKVICTQLRDEFDDFAGMFDYRDNQQKHILLNTSNDSFFKAIPADGKTLDGVNPHLAIIDEYHEAKDSSIPDNMASGSVLRDQPLILYVTTRGFNINGPLKQLEDYCINVLKGVSEDDTIFPLIHALDDDDNWENKNVWIKCNPGLGTAPTMEALEKEQSKGIDKGGQTLVSTKTKNFNIWVRTSRIWLPDKTWMKGADPIDLEELYQRRCFSAVDLAHNDDLSVLGYFFPPEDGKKMFKFIVRAFCPEMGIDRRSREHKVPYQSWVDKGILIPTDGNLTDTNVIAGQIREDFSEFEVEQIAFDKHFALELLNQLLAEGFPVLAYPQNYASMSPAIIKIEELIGKGLLQHGGNPLLRWMFGNVKIKKDGGGRMIFDRSHSFLKIDAFPVLAMCVGCWLESLKEEQYSNYEGDGLSFIG